MVGRSGLRVIGINVVDISGSEDLVVIAVDGGGGVCGGSVDVSKALQRLKRIK